MTTPTTYKLLAGRIAPRFQSHSLTFRLPSIVTLLLLAIMSPYGLGFSACPSLWLFNLPCPACGLTRSMSSLLHWHWADSFMFHPLGVIVLFWLIITAITNQPDFLNRATRQYFQRDYGRSLMTGWTAIILLVWIVRLI